MARYEWKEGARMAHEIIERHPEVFSGVPCLNDILFVYDDENTPTRQGDPVLARVCKITGKFKDFVCEGNKLWMLEWFAASVGDMTINQKRLLMAHELLHFTFDPERGVYRIRGHDVEEFSLILNRFGPRWTSPTRGDVDDILAADFHWGTTGQSRLRFDVIRPADRGA